MPISLDYRKACGLSIAGILVANWNLGMPTVIWLMAIDSDFVVFKTQSDFAEHRRYSFQMTKHVYIDRNRILATNSKKVSFGPRACNCFQELEVRFSIV